MTDDGPSPARTDAAVASTEARDGAGSDTKATLRSELRQARRARRDATTPSARQRDAARLLAHVQPLLDGAACVASFEPLRTEADVTAINAHVVAGARLIVPITLDDLDLSWRDAATGADLGKDAIGGADVILTPALAIGPNGERLGQGGGCYDRALPRRRRDAVVVAVVHPDEIDRDLPVEAHDEPVEAVVTTAGLVRFAQHAAPRQGDVTEAGSPTE